MMIDGRWRSGGGVGVVHLAVLMVHRAQTGAARQVHAHLRPMRLLLLLLLLLAMLGWLERLRMLLRGMTADDVDVVRPTRFGTHRQSRSSASSSFRRRRSHVIPVGVSLPSSSATASTTTAVSVVFVALAPVRYAAHGAAGLPGLVFFAQRSAARLV